jgi:hypothetical protein
MKVALSVNSEQIISLKCSERPYSHELNDEFEEDRFDGCVKRFGRVHDQPLGAYKQD